jgi:hypothetical protein
LGEDEAIFRGKPLDARPRIYEAQGLIYEQGRDKRGGLLMNVEEKRLRERIEG